MMLLEQYRYRLDRHALGGYLRNGWPLLLVPGGWFTFMAFCRWQFGDWFAYQHAQEKGWGISVQNPLSTAWQGLTAAGQADSIRVWLALATVTVVVLGAITGGLKP